MAISHMSDFNVTKINHSPPFFFFFKRGPEDGIKTIILLFMLQSSRGTVSSRAYTSTFQATAFKMKALPECLAFSRQEPFLKLLYIA